jgi:hypothetical protein
MDTNFRPHSGAALVRFLTIIVLLAIASFEKMIGAEPEKTKPASEKSARIFSSAGLPNDENFFPIAVWLQSTANAAKYKALGINLYVALWRGPNEEQLRELTDAGMAVICSQNEFARRHKENPTIAAWMHGDEPDNAQSLGKGKGYGPPITPEKIVADYARLRSVDPSRPVLLNLGQGVAWDDWIGRGVRRNHPEDYPKYVEGGDIISFDIYPVVHDSPEVAGKLEFVAHGVSRLVEWTEGGKPIWSCIECTHISNPQQKASPAQVRAEVWMALVRGARGLIYFVHQFQPAFKEAALLDDAEMMSAVTKINGEIRELAPVLNSPSLPEAVRVTASDAKGDIGAMLKRRGGRTFLFAVNLRNAPSKASFVLPGAGDEKRLSVHGEGREIALRDGKFEDAFEPYGVHRYELAQ